MNTENFVKDYEALNRKLIDLQFFSRQDFYDLSKEDAQLMAYAHAASFKAACAILSHFMPPCDGYAALANDLKENKFLEAVTNLESLAKALDEPEVQVSYGFMAALVKFAQYHPESVNLFEPVYDFLMAHYPEKPLKQDEINPIDAVNQATEFIKNLRNKNPKEDH